MITSVESMIERPDVVQVVHVEKHAQPRDERGELGLDGARLVLATGPLVAHECVECRGGGICWQVLCLWRPDDVTTESPPADGRRTHHAHLVKQHGTLLLSYHHSLNPHRRRKLEDGSDLGAALDDRGGQHGYGGRSALTRLHTTGPEEGSAGCYVH